MKNFYWLLVLFSAILYALPFLFSDVLWPLIFIFPVPLLYVTRIQDLSFIHGYIWGSVVFLLQLSDGIYIVIHLARDSWLIGFLMGIGVVLYQALVPALLFLCATMMARFFLIQSPMLRLCIWTIALLLFIVWTDQICMWIFGIREGYPLMHPLLLLAQQPGLLLLLPIFGKQLVTMLFLLVPASFVLLLWYRNGRTLLLALSVCLMWLLCWVIGFTQETQPYWYHQIKSLPCMIHATGNNPVVIIKIVVRRIKNIIEQYPCTTIVIMPESALNITDFESKSELLCLWNEEYLGKPIHLIFGTCRWKDSNYYNSLHHVHNGILQVCFDKKHAMLITERLSAWMNYDLIRNIYFKDGLSITQSCNNRIPLKIFEDIFFVPYICSELFFNDFPDDYHENLPVIAIINDTLLTGSYIQKLLLLLARLRAIQWQREIVYVSYGRSVFINKQGTVREMNE